MWLPKLEVNSELSDSSSRKVLKVAIHRLIKVKVVISSLNTLDLC